MKVKSFDKNKKKKTYIIFGVSFMVIAIIAITLYRSFALYQEEKTYNVLKGMIPDFSKSDIALTYTINGKESTGSFPVKASGYTGVATCESGVEASWDNEEWGLSIINSNNQSNIICNIDFKELETLVEYITKLSETSEEIVDDETNDHNLRYIGANPNNYVSFNGELWRVIGVMNNVADENGVIEPRIKLIRRTSIGSYSFDNKPSGTGSSISDNGSNDWTDSAIKEVLNNGAYYNRTSGECPSGRNGATIVCDFSNTGLTEESKKMISKIKWKLGSVTQFDNYMTSNLYRRERGGNEWIGEVGLVYPSDYGYATGGGETTDRNTCLDTSLSSWDGASISDCKNNDWFKNSMWTMTKVNGTSTYVYYLYNGTDIASLRFLDVYVSSNIYPTIYLKTNIKITSGTGTESDPYIPEM